MGENTVWTTKEMEYMRDEEFLLEFTRVHKEYRLILYNKRNERRYETNVKHMGRGQHEKENKKHQFYNDYDLAFGSNSMRAKI